MSTTEANNAIEEVGPTEPTFNMRPIIFVDSRDREYVFKHVAFAVSAFKEIQPCLVPSHTGLRHLKTGNPLNEAWLFEYLNRVIKFLYLYDEEKDGQVPDWLPPMMVARGREFSDHMWGGIFEAE